MHEYEERYVAFIDILGFRSLVDRAEADARLLERLASVLEDVRQFSALEAHMDAPRANDPRGFWQGMFRMSTFSDCILISTKVNPIGLGLVTFDSAVICNRLLHQGVFTRGAICRGRLIHSSTIVLGAGLIKAYELEKAAAVYPRILLDDAICDGMAELKSQGGSPDLRRQDFDGMWHLHILDKSILDLNQHTAKSEFENLNQPYMALCRQEIEHVLHSTDDISIRAKVGWLARYFNQYAVDYGLKEISVAQGMADNGEAR